MRHVSPDHGRFSRLSTYYLLSSTTRSVVFHLALSGGSMRYFIVYTFLHVGNNTLENFDDFTLTCARTCTGKNICVLAVGSSLTQHALHMCVCWPCVPLGQNGKLNAVYVYLMIVEPPATARHLIRFASFFLLFAN